MRDLLIVLFIANVVVGCGASALERHTMAAGGLHAMASGAGRLIEVKARLDATAADADGPEAVAAAVDRYRPAAAAQHLLAAAVEAYIEAVIVAAGDDKPDFRDARRLLANVLDLYETTRVLLAEYDIQIPQLPEVVLGILGAR